MAKTKDKEMTIDNLAKEMRNDLAKINQRLDRMDKRFEDSDKRFAKIDKQLGGKV
jgi:RNA binding exosome subunit